jgi:hypothetical protein
MTQQPTHAKAMLTNLALSKESLRQPASEARSQGMNLPSRQAHCTLSCVPTCKGQERRATASAPLQSGDEARDLPMRVTTKGESAPRAEALSKRSLIEEKQ